VVYPNLFVCKSIGPYITFFFVIPAVDYRGSRNEIDSKANITAIAGSYCD